MIVRRGYHIAGSKVGNSEVGDSDAATVRGRQRCRDSDQDTEHIYAEGTAEWPCLA